MVAPAPGKMLHSMRELNRKGVLTKFEDLDSKYLQKFFLGGKSSKEIELSEASPNLTCLPMSVLLLRPTFSLHMARDVCA